MIDKIGHVGIVVEDINKWMKLFSEKFGLKTSHVFVSKKDGLKMAYIHIGKDKIELLEPTRQEPPFQNF